MPGWRRLCQIDPASLGFLCSWAIGAGPANIDCDTATHVRLGLVSCILPVARADAELMVVNFCEAALPSVGISTAWRGNLTQLIIRMTRSSPSATGGLAHASER
jgi:hypothetical protein